MSRSVRIHEFGDASVLRIVNVEVGGPAPGEVRLRIQAVRQRGLAGGAFHPTIAGTFPLEQIADAHRFIEAGEQVGKIVVTL